jgi:hypothetical protein
MDRGNSVQVLAKVSLSPDVLVEEQEAAASRLADLVDEPADLAAPILDRPERVCTALGYAGEPTPVG